MVSVWWSINCKSLEWLYFRKDYWLEISTMFINFLRFSKKSTTSTELAKSWFYAFYWYDTRPGFLFSPKLRYFDSLDIKEECRTVSFKQYKQSVKRLQHRCFPVNFVKKFKNIFFHRIPPVAASETDEKWINHDYLREYLLAIDMTN